MPDPITAQRLRELFDAAEQGLGPGLPVEILEAADRIEALEELLRQSLADPDTNWKTAWADAVREALDA